MVGLMDELDPCFDQKGKETPLRLLTDGTIHTPEAIARLIQSLEHCRWTIVCGFVKT